MRGKALVTGGAGFVGSHLVDRLVDEGWGVLAIDDLSHGHVDHLAAARSRGSVRFHQLDIRAPELIAAAERFRPDVVFHLAAQAAVPASVEQPLLDADINILGSINVLECARRAGAQRVVFASSGGAIYGSDVKLPARESFRKRPESPYGVSKKVVEDYFRYYRDAYGLDYALLALTNVYGPRQDPHGEAGVVAIFCRALLNGRPPVIYGSGIQTRDFVYVEDVADAFVRAAAKGDGRLLNIGTGRETSVLEVFEVLAGLTGFRGRPGFGAARPGDVLRSVVDPAAAERHLGWKSWTALEEGLRRTVEWFRSPRTSAAD